MASSDATARIKADALKSLKEAATVIATQLGIEPPNLEFFFKDKDYQQAQELTVLAAWLTTVGHTVALVSSALPQDSHATEGGDNVGHPKTKNPRPGG